MPCPRSLFHKDILIPTPSQSVIPKGDLGLSVALLLKVELWLWPKVTVPLLSMFDSSMKHLYLCIISFDGKIQAVLKTLLLGRF